MLKRTNEIKMIMLAVLLAFCLSGCGLPKDLPDRDRVERHSATETDVNEDGDSPILGDAIMSDGAEKETAKEVLDDADAADSTGVSGEHAVNDSAASDNVANEEAADGNDTSVKNPVLAPITSMQDWWNDPEEADPYEGKEIPEKVSPYEKMLTNEGILELGGIKLSICGDSVSTYSGYIPSTYSVFYPDGGGISDVNSTWWMRLINLTGMQLCSNASYSGGFVTGPSASAYENPFPDADYGRYGCGDQRIKDLRGKLGNPDVIFIYMGINDMTAKKPIGDNFGTRKVEDGDIETFSDAYTLMLDKIQTAYPEAAVFCFCFHKIFRENGETGETWLFQNELGLTTSDYNNCIRKIAENRNLMLVDLEDCGIELDNFREYTIDGTHPNEVGAELIYKKALNSLYLVSDKYAETVQIRAYRSQQATKALKLKTVNDILNGKKHPEDSPEFNQNAPDIGCEVE